MGRPTARGHDAYNMVDEERRWQHHHMLVPLYTPSSQISRKSGRKMKDWRGEIPLSDRRGCMLRVGRHLKAIMVVVVHPTANDRL